MKFKKYGEEDYERVCDFLIALNRESKTHINWNWARFEWMAEHPEFDKSSRESIGLWLNGEKIVGAAIYDMYFGEAFCGVLPGYEKLYAEVLEYAYAELSDDSGIGVAISDENTGEIEVAVNYGFRKAEQSETIMQLDLNRVFPAELPEGFRFEELDPVERPYDFQWILWQGFDHGEDRKEFEQTEEIIPQRRKHLNRQLSLLVEEGNTPAAYCCLWYDERTEYAYVEPVCTAPAYRGKGLARAVLYEALNRARRLGAQTVYVISDLAFYERLGFRKQYDFSFYWKQ